MTLGHCLQARTNSARVIPEKHIMRSSACAMAMMVWVLGVIGPRGQAVSSELPLTRIADIRLLTRQEAAEKVPVRVRGIVQWTFGIEGSFDFTVADDSGAIYVATFSAVTRASTLDEAGRENDMTSLDLRIGMEVEVEGLTSAGGYAPVIDPLQIRVIGVAPALPVRTLSVADLYRGSEDAQRVELEPVVVQSVRENSVLRCRDLRVCSRSGNYALVSVHPAPWNEPDKVIDAEVLVRGTVLTLFNSRLEQIGVRVSVPTEDDFHVLRSPPTDPFAVPMIEVGELRLFRPDGLSTHRNLVEGTVTLVAANELVIQNGDRGVSVKSTPPNGLMVGDHVLVAGFVEARQSIAFITDAIVKKISSGTTPQPTSTTVEHIVETCRENAYRDWEVHPEDFDHRLVQIQGTVIGAVSRGADPFAIQTNTGKQIMVRFAAESSGFAEAIEAGSVVNVVGIAIVKQRAAGPVADSSKAPFIELLLRGSEDVHLLQAPSWWSRERLGIALVSTAGVLLAAMTWVMVLRRTVKKQSQRIETALRTHRDAELELNAATRERIRLAGDLHDGVHQLLSAASYRLESVAELSSRDPAAAINNLQIAQKVLNHSQNEMRALMWGIHELANAPPDFVQLLEQALARMGNIDADMVEIRRVGQPQPVPPRAAGSLLLLAQEAVANAIRHGKATHILVLVDFAEHSLSLVIHDNGIGFDRTVKKAVPQGGFGLGNMRRRVQELSGTITVDSELGHGTKITVVLAWTELCRLLQPTSLHSSVS